MTESTGGCALAAFIITGIILLVFTLAEKIITKLFGETAFIVLLVIFGIAVIIVIIKLAIDTKN